MAELYRFTAGGDIWRYTDGKRDVVYGGNTHTAKPIKRTKWDRKPDDDTLRITCPDDIDPLPQFITSNPVTSTLVEVLTSSGTLIFAGKIVSVEFDGRGSAQIIAHPTSRMTTGDVPLHSYSTTCDWNLGDSNCGIDLETGTSPGGDAFKCAVTASAITVSSDGKTLTHADFGTFDDDWFTNGRALLGSESVFVMSHEGTSINLLVPFQTAFTGTFTVYAGCPKSMTFCDSKFGNTPNFGGCPWAPVRNPAMDGFD